VNETFATVWLTLLLVLAGMGAGFAASTTEVAEVAVVTVAADGTSRRRVVPARRPGLPLVPRCFPARRPVAADAAPPATWRPRPVLRGPPARTDT
jgi:hypothetical protein